MWRNDGAGNDGRKGAGGGCAAPRAVGGEPPPAPSCGASDRIGGGAPKRAKQGRNRVFPLARSAFLSQVCGSWTGAFEGLAD